MLNVGKRVPNNLSTGLRIYCRGWGTRLGLGTRAIGEITWVLLLARGVHNKLKGIHVIKMIVLLCHTKTYIECLKLFLHFLHIHSLAQ